MSHIHLGSLALAACDIGLLSTRVTSVTGAPLLPHMMLLVESENLMGGVVE